MKVLVIGAGRMGAIRVEDLVADKRVTQVLIANRNAEKSLTGPKSKPLKLMLLWLPLEPTPTKKSWKWLPLSLWQFFVKSQLRQPLLEP
jgi:hypothetical protein